MLSLRVRTFARLRMLTCLCFAIIRHHTEHVAIFAERRRAARNAAMRYLYYASLRLRHADIGLMPISPPRFAASIFC